MERERLLEHLGPESVSAALTLASRAKQGRFTREKAFAFLVVLPVLPFFLNFRRVSPEFREVMVIQFVMLHMITTGGVAGYFATSLQRRIITLLANQDDPQLLAAMVEAFDLPGKQVGAAIDSSLARMLGNIDTEDFFILSRAKRQQISDKCPFRSPALADAVVSVVDRVGDTDALRYIGIIAEGRTTSATIDRRIRHRAKQCEAVLLAKLDKQKREASLLRAAGPPSGDLFYPAEHAQRGEDPSLKRPVDL